MCSRRCRKLHALQASMEPAWCYVLTRMVRGYSIPCVFVNERMSLRAMAINSAGLQPGQGAGEGNNGQSQGAGARAALPPLNPEVLESLSALSFRCVECGSRYPVIEPIYSRAA